MQCARCEADNREGRLFCARCGAPLPAGCSACGFVNRPDDSFCGGCGGPLVQGAERARAHAGSIGPEPWTEGERRHVTVLFCDLAGYTRLTHELGAEVVHELTDRFFATTDGLIERFGGSIDKHIGDCVMGVFGAPVAHGNDAERTVRAALAIRDAVPALSQEVGRKVGVHIGIASGQVVASGGAGFKTFSITGDSVNLASRLTDQAEQASSSSPTPCAACSPTASTVQSSAGSTLRAWAVRCRSFG